LPKTDDDIPELTLTVIDANKFTIQTDSFEAEVKVGELFEKNNISIKVDEIQAKPGTSFTVEYLSKLKAINDLRDVLTVSDQGKDTGMLTLSLTGDDPVQIRKILDSISNNYLMQNIDRQAAQDAKSLEFLNRQLPQV
ncbi:TPA: tyrosine-protein kinase, partial [Klebsiella pneumoniae]|nr:tyrosine-protein kinase [Klebsiella pneumoniae]